jgi:hypothetical protein
MSLIDSSVALINATNELDRLSKGLLDTEKGIEILEREDGDGGV